MKIRVAEGGIYYSHNEDEMPSIHQSYYLFVCRASIFMYQEPQPLMSRLRAWHMKIYT